MAATRRDFLSAMGAASVGGLAVAQPAGADRTGFQPDLVYLNTGSLGPTIPAARQRVLDIWQLLELNPVVNSYNDGAALAAAEAARRAAASFIGCSPDQLLITNGTTDALNSAVASIRLSAGDAVLTTDQEHHAGTAAWAWRARRDGIRIDRVSVPPTENDAAAIVARFAAAIRPETRVIAFSHVLFSTGLRMPAAALAALARSRGLLCVVDGAQALGMIPLDVGAIGCHAYAASGHKWLMGPKGTGLLYVSPDAADRIQPVRWELGHSYVAESSGMGPLPLVAGLGTAVEAARARGMEETERRILALRNPFWRGLATLPRVTMASPPPGPLATGLVAIRLPDAIEARPLLIRMRERHGIIGRAIPADWFNGLRFSTHIFNTEAEIGTAVAALRAELA